MYFNPPTPGNNPTNPFWHPLNQRMNPQPVQEAVTVELQFKKDADGKKAGGKKVRDKVYKMTFKNDAEMNKFMDANAKILDEDTEELEESTPEYRAMMKRYKGSDMEKVFKILDKEGFRMGEQSDTLVRNMLKRHKGNVKKAADQIMKDNPGMFDVNRMMMDDVQLDEKVMTFTFRKTEDAREFERKAFSLANSTDIMMMPGGERTGVEVSTMGPKDDKRLISLAKKMGGRVHKIVEDVEQIDENAPATKIIDAAMKRIGIGFKVSGQVIKVNPLNVSRAKEELSKVLKRKGTDMNKTGMSVVKDDRIPVAESVELDESNIIDSLVEIAESCGEVD